jgi:hypothetical protein
MNRSRASAIGGHPSPVGNHPCISGGLSEQRRFLCGPLCSLGVSLCHAFSSYTEFHRGSHLSAVFFGGELHREDFSVVLCAHSVSLCVTLWLGTQRVTLASLPQLILAGMLLTLLIIEKVHFGKTINLHSCRR